MITTAYRSLVIKERIRRDNYVVCIVDDDSKRLGRIYKGRGRMPGYKWVPYTGMRTTLPGMICAGRDADGATLVVGRATHNGDVLPAKAKPEHGVAYVAYGSYEHEKRHFEILMPADFHWVASRNGQVPPNAVQSGTTSNGEPLFVGRGYQQGTPTVGKVHPSHGCLYVPFAGREVALKEYEVLVQM